MLNCNLILTLLVGAWLNGTGCLLKLSRHHQITGTIFARSIHKFSPAFAKALWVTTEKKTLFKQAPHLDAVTAYGSDETLKQIRTRIGRTVRIFNHGHRISAGILFKSSLRRSELRKTAKACAKDAWLYDQRGCLSPQIYFVQGAAEEFARELYQELMKLNRRFGPVHRPYEVQIGRRLSLDQLLTESLSPNRLSWFGHPLHSDQPIVYQLKDSKFRYPTLGQVVGVKAFQNPKNIRRELSLVLKYLHCVSFAGSQKDQMQLEKIFRRSRVIRMCPVGHMQNPPLGWELSS